MEHQPEDPGHDEQDAGQEGPGEWSHYLLLSKVSRTSLNPMEASSSRGGFVGLAGLIIFQHRSNIARLRRGEEPKIGGRGRRGDVLHESDDDER